MKTKLVALEQLIISTIKRDNIELEERRREIHRQREDLQEKQYNLQNQLLEGLANSTGDILQNKVIYVEEIFCFSFIFKHFQFQIMAISLIEIIFQHSTYQTSLNLLKIPHTQFIYD